MLIVSFLLSNICVAGALPPPLMFSRDEIVALVTGARMVKAWGGLAMARAAEEAIIKIEAVLPEQDQKRLQTTAVYAPSFEQGIVISEAVRRNIDVLEIATNQSHDIRFDYLDGENHATVRHVMPLGLLFWGSTWTLAAWCYMRQDFRTFRIDRMDELIVGAYVRPVKGQTLLDFYAAMQQRDRARGVMNDPIL